MLNLLRVEEVNPEIMLEKSFCQFQNYASVPGMIDKLKSLEAERDSFQIPNEESITAYYRIRQQLKKLANDMLTYIHKPKNSLPYLQPGRLIQVKNNDCDFGWGVVLNFQKKANQKSGPVKSEPLYVIEALLNCSSKSVKSADGETPMPCGPDEKGEMQVVPILLHLVQAISAVRLYIPKDLRSLDSRQGVGKSLQEVKRRFPDGLPLLDPIEDMGIKDNGLRTVVRKTEMLEHRMFTHPLHKDSSLESLYGQYEQKAKVIAQIKLVKKELKKTKTILQLDELKCRKRVLRRLGYATAADVIELKGRVACELSSGDELLLTEMIFNGVFNELTVQQCVALLSCFVFEEKCDELPKLTEELAGPLRQMQESARRIGKVSEEAKLNINVETYVEKFKPNIMDVVFAWANGASFAQICKMTDAFEGSIIRAMRRLEELLRQMCQAAKAIGNTELENKFAEGIIKIKRDIIFAASLYL